MRVIAGRFHGRQLCVPHSGLRPTTDLVKGALFNILGDVAGMRFLDLYAGSGSVGIEALSRGAAMADFVDSDRRACQAIRRNLEMLGLAPGVFGLRTAAFLGRFHGPGYDIVFLDPPYGDRAESDRLHALPLASLLAPGGRLVWEQSSREPLPAPSGLRRESERLYGDTRLAFFVLVTAEDDTPGDDPGRGVSLNSG